MAGAGWRDFIAGEVLTAANVQDYLQDQAVMTFASSAARGSAIASPTEGMVSFLKDSNRVEIYDGSAWKQFGATTGGILQVVSTTKTDTFSASIAGSGFSSNITGLAATISPSSTSSKILVLASINGSSGANEARFSYRFDRGGTAIGIGDAAGSRARLTGRSWALSDGAAIIGVNMAYLDSPASTSALTYGVQINNHAGITTTYYVNRSGTDTDNPAYGRTISTIILMEIAG